MANTKSAKKQILVSKRNQDRNVQYKSALKTAIKKARLAITGGDSAVAQEQVNAAVGSLYKSVTKGIIKKQNASRRVGRLMRAFNKQFTTPAA